MEQQSPELLQLNLELKMKQNNQILADFFFTDPLTVIVLNKIHHCLSLFVLKFTGNVILTGMVILWQPVTHFCISWLSHTRTDKTFIIKASAYFSHMHHCPFCWLLVVLQFNTTLTAKVISWRSVKHYAFPGFLTPVLTQLFFPKPPTTFVTCFCRGER